jgi:hypothetical protein
MDNSSHRMLPMAAELRANNIQRRMLEFQHERSECSMPWIRMCKYIANLSAYRNYITSHCILKLLNFAKDQTMLRPRKSAILYVFFWNHGSDVFPYLISRWLVACRGNVPEQFNRQASEMSARFRLFLWEFVATAWPLQPTPPWRKGSLLPWKRGTGPASLR